MIRAILSKVLEKRKGVVGLLALLLILLSVYANLISTQEMYPSEVYICGNYSNSTQITASRIYNNENYTLNNVVATIVANQTGLVYLSNISLNLGSIAPLSYSSIEPTWVIGCDEGNVGSYLIYVLYNGDNFSESSLNDSFTRIFVVSTPPKIINKKPTGSTNKNNVSLEITSDEDAYCRFSEWDTDYYSMVNQMGGNKIYHSYSLNLVDGVYSYYVRCVDYYNNVMQSSEKVEFVVDSIPPILTIGSPSGLLSLKDVFLNVSTDENAVCKFDAHDINYDEMSNSLIGSLLTHKAQLTLNEGEHIFYVKCKDNAGNIGRAMISFEIDLPPTASIEIGIDKERIKEGIIEVKLKTSENVQPTPKLYYKFDNTDIRKEVSLEGSDREWSGYMVITQKSNELIGSFEFSAKDLVGNVGTEITSGKLFIVDTLEPPSPTDLYVKKIGKNKVNLKWYYDGEKVDHFNIYRSTEPYVNYANLLISPGSSSYTDIINESVATYFYRVSAVDVAGNEGELSNEVNVTINKSLLPNTIALANGSVIDLLISEDAFNKINSKLKEAEELRVDIDFVVSNLGKMSGADGEVVERLGLLEDVQTSGQEINTIIAELNSLRYSSLSDKEIDKRIEVFDNEISNINRETPAEVFVLEESEFEQELDEGDMDKVISELPLQSFDEEDKEDYKNINFALQSNIMVKKQIRIVRVDYLNGDSKNKTIIRNIVTGTLGESSNMIVVEYIPKSVVYSTSEIEFSDFVYEVLVDDPVIRYKLEDVLDYGVEYTINEFVDLDSAKQIKTYVLFDYLTYQKGAISEKELVSQEAYTGYSVFSQQMLGLTNTEAIMIIIGVVFVFGLFIYYVLFVKKIFHKRIDEYVVEEKKEVLKKEIGEMERLKGEDSSSDYMSSMLEKAKKETPKKEDKEVLIKISKLIEEAEEALNNNKREEAVELYSKVREHYAKLSKQYKGYLYKRCKEIHKKLMVIIMFEER